MMCAGIVTNVTNFGAFVDIGVHQDGLVHISQLADRFVKDPREVVSPGDRVSARVLDVKLDKQQIALSLKSGLGSDVARGPRPEQDRRGGGPNRGPRPVRSTPTAEPSLQQPIRGPQTGREVAQARGEPPSFSRRVPSREGMGTLSGFPYLLALRQTVAVDARHAGVDAGEDLVGDRACPRGHFFDADGCVAVLT
jgi:predicted RNA-binding protein with RPS1 domain